MKVYLRAEPLITNGCGVGWLSVSFKDFEAFKKKFEDMGFEFVSEAPTFEPSQSLELKIKGEEEKEK
jgi:hypothetical protein